MVSRNIKKKILKVPGFEFSGVHCGLKTDPKKNDLGLVRSQVPAKLVGVFTQNQVKAAPVLNCMSKIDEARFSALVVNSGLANASIGARGKKDALAMTRRLAKLASVDEKSVYVCSTGKIGVPLPIEKVEQGIEAAYQKLSDKNAQDFVQAIMTTDAFPKYEQLSGRLQDQPYQLLGMAKGAGMIEPNMATMLAFLFTDLNLPLAFMQKTLREVVDATFNSVTVDGDTSTNDTLLWMANGLAQNKARLSQGEKTQIKDQVYQICLNLAKMLVQDGEGATKLVKIEVLGAKTDAIAKKLAKSVANSTLVKTALYGEDPNWGRILAALGYAGETFNPDQVDIFIDSVQIVCAGTPIEAPIAGRVEEKAHKKMKKAEFTIKIVLGTARGKAQVFTSDLGLDYVKFNSEYST